MIWLTVQGCWMVIITFYPICQGFFNYCIQNAELKRIQDDPAILNLRSFVKKFAVISEETPS